MAPAPVNEPVWDSEDSALSEPSPHREWALQDTKQGHSAQGHADKMYQETDFSQWKTESVSSDVRTVETQFPKPWVKNSKQKILERFTVMMSDLLSPFSMTASSSSDVCLVPKEFSLQTFAMLPCPALLAWSAHTHTHTNTQEHTVRLQRYKPEVTWQRSHFPHVLLISWTALFTACLRVAPKNTSSLCP